MTVDLFSKIDRDPPLWSMHTSNMKLIGALGLSYGVHKLFYHIFFIVGFRFSPKLIGIFHSRSSLAVLNMNLI